MRPFVHSFPVIGISLTAALAVTANVARAAVIIDPVYDASFSGNANFAALQATVNDAISIYATSLANNLTIPITFKLDPSVSGAQSSFLVSNFSFNSYLNKLTLSATTADDATALASIGSGPNDPVLGKSTLSVPVTLAYALGLRSTPLSSFGTVSFNTSLFETNPAGFAGVIQHEINEVLGTASNLPNGGGTLPSAIRPVDLFRYTSAGARSFDLNNSSDSANKAFFRLGPTSPNLQEWNNLPNGGDYGDWAANGSFPASAQDYAGNPAVARNMTAGGAELVLLDVIGYNAASVPEPREMAWLSGLALMAFAGWRRLKS